MERAKALEKEGGHKDAVRFCYQKAYFDSSSISESFFHYYKDVIGNPYLEPVHRKYSDFFSDPWPLKMLQASRDTFKSSMAVSGYVTWRVGREFILTGESRIRVLLASESCPLATRNLRWAKQVMSWNKRWIDLCGDHQDREKGGLPWGVQQLTSKHRIDSNIAEPTLMPIGIDAGRTGFHYNLIVCDDLEAETTSASASQIDKVYDFYKLLHSLKSQEGGEILLLCTRWHHDDIYQRIEDLNREVEKDEQFKILKIPAHNFKTGRLNFPKRLPEKKLKHLKKTQGSHIYHCQYELTPVAEEDRVFKKEDIRWVTPQHLRQSRLNIYTSADFAWTEMKRIDFARGKKPDWTVIMTVAVDEQWNYIVLDWYRERCSKSAAVKELYRQHFFHESIMTILQKYDRSQIADTIDQYGYEYGRAIVPQWVSYPPDTKKVTRIENTLQPKVEDHKLFLMPDMQWLLEDEMLDFPRSRSKSLDGLDVLANIIHFGKPTARSKMLSMETPDSRRHKKLMAGLNPWDEEAESWKNI